MPAGGSLSSPALFRRQKNSKQIAHQPSADKPRDGFCWTINVANARLKAYLRENLYQHHRIERMKDKSRRILMSLYVRYHQNPRLLPDETRRRAADQGLERNIADYIAGMTDRYATEEYLRLYDPATRV